MTAKIIDALVVTTLGGPAGGADPLEMSVELGPGALDPLPVISRPAALRDEMAARFEAYQYRRAKKDAEKRQKRQEIKTAYAQDRTAARRYRLANPYPSGYAQRLQNTYADQVARHGLAMGYLRPAPHCSASRARYLGQGRWWLHDKFCSRLQKSTAMAAWW